VRCHGPATALLLESIIIRVVPTSLPRSVLAAGARRPLLVGSAAVLAVVSLGGAALAYYGTDAHLSVGYSPVQPVEFSHKLHAGDLGLDCRYCHFTVERSPDAAVPSTEVCMNCHAKVRPDSVKLLPVRATFAENRALGWVRAHKVPDFAYFDHGAHLAACVGCSTCHGRVDQMPRIEQRESLTMGWCLDCHRNPRPFLRHPGDITKMDWAPGGAPPEQPVAGGRRLDPPTYCSGCHR
jgi:hypothetical protein